MKRVDNRHIFTVIILLAFFISMPESGAQNLKLGVHADPLITWVKSSNSEYNTEGVRPGFSLGMNVLYYFESNYAFSTGIGFFNAGGRVSTDNAHTLVFNNSAVTINAGDEIIYSLKYLSLPAGFRLQTNQIGYLTIFTDLGLDFRALLRSSVDLPQQDIENEVAQNEVYGMNMGWHIHAGIEYELGINTMLVAGLGYDEDFFDITKDLEEVFQPEDRSGLRMIRIRLGIMF